MHIQVLDCSLPEFKMKHKIILFIMSEKPQFMGVKFGDALWEDHRLSVKDRCGVRYLCFRGSNGQEAGENCNMTSFVLCTAHRIVLV
jgi:hypothetical protein